MCPPIKRQVMREELERMEDEWLEYHSEEDQVRPAHSPPNCIRGSHKEVSGSHRRLF